MSRVAGGLTRRWAAIVAWGLFVALTNATPSWSGTARQLSDIDSYEAIASAAPKFPTVDLPLHHSQRFVLHWLTGEVSGLSGLTLHACYLAGTAAAVAMLLFATEALLRGITNNPLLRFCGLGLAATSVFPVRYGIAVPGMLTDTAFAASVAVLVGAVLSRRWPLAVAALTIACLARPQTALPLGAITAWGWSRDHEGRVAPALIAIAPVVLYVVLTHVASGFAAPGSAHLEDITRFGAATSLPGTAVHHVARLCSGVALPLALAAAALARWWRNRPRELDHARALCFAFAAAIVLQPLPAALNSEWVQNADGRLAGLGVVPLVALVCRTLETTPPLRRTPRLACSHAPALMVCAIALGSLHYLWSVAPVGKTFDAALVAAACTILVAVGAGVPQTSRTAHPTGV